VRSPSDLVLRFLGSIGRPSEAELYLKLFRADAAERFALIAVDEALVGVALEALALDLHFLVELGLSPVIALPSPAAADRLREALDEAVRAMVVGPEAAALVARAGGLALVVVPPAGTSGDPLAELASALVTRKLVLLGPRAGLGDGGELVSLVDLTTEFELVHAGLPAEDAAVLERVRGLVDAVRHPLTVAVTSPLNLLRELFTVRGAGTLVRRGAQIARHDGLDGVDRPRLEELLATSFDGALRPEFWQLPIERTYVADDYRGAAVVTAAAPAPYLSKFAVEARARGEGVGRDLWRALCRDYPAFFWRSRPGNPISSWYQVECHGMARTGRWQIFWRGLAIEDIAAAIELGRDAAPDFG
jgi:hypothetical protein